MYRDEVINGKALGRIIAIAIAISIVFIFTKKSGRRPPHFSGGRNAVHLQHK